MSAQEKEFLKAAARVVEEQVLDNSTLGIPVDPEVADFMGAFAEDSERLGEVLSSTEGADDGFDG